MTRRRPVLIVQRYDYERLRNVRERFAQEGGDVVPDRRALDRRSPDPRSPDRRRAGRRTKWAAKFPSSSFMVVPSDFSDQWGAPAPSDLLTNKIPLAASDHLSVVPGPVQAKYDSYKIAVERARRYVSFAHVDLWYTEDRATFVLLGMHRPAPASFTDADSDR